MQEMNTGDETMRQGPLKVWRWLVLIQLAIVHFLQRSLLVITTHPTNASARAEPGRMQVV